MWWIALSAQRTVGSAPEPAEQPQLRAVETPEPTRISASDVKVITDFKEKVDAYDKLRKDLAKKAPPLKKTDDPTEIARAEKALAEQIKEARAGARPGDIFTPETRRVFNAS